MPKLLPFLFVSLAGALALAADRPNFILVMTDDQGWGEMGYYDHPILKTPNLDEMAANGIRFDRFYAGGPNCSPTRASVLTGRQHMRTGVTNHGRGLRPQELTIARVLSENGYQTGHFGKWHLNGLRGPGMPVFADDTRSPGSFGFTRWISATNYIDVDPLMGDQGKPRKFAGDSSDIVVDEALKFIGEAGSDPFLAVIWYGTPHSPFKAIEKDMNAYPDLEEKQKKYFGELNAMDRSIGTLRAGVRKLGLADNTLIWFCSDNGGVLRAGGPATNGGLRGEKNTMFEGGLRVPGIIEWPAGVKEGKITGFPACTMDIFPTLADLAGITGAATNKPMDGISLKPLIEGGAEARRSPPIPFYHDDHVVWLDNDFKLYSEDATGGKYVLYHLGEDPKETTDVSASHPEVFARMKKEAEAWLEGAGKSIAGADYPEGKLTEPDFGDVGWGFFPRYRALIKEFDMPESKQSKRTEDGKNPGEEKADKKEKKQKKSNKEKEASS